MTRNLEAIFRRALRVLSFLMLACAAALAVFIMLGKNAPTRLEVPKAPDLTQKKENLPPLDPRYTKLAVSKMTKTIVPTAETVQKPVAPNLGSLIRVKGIMDYGDPKTCEAIVESLRSNKTKSYRIGDTIDDVSAKVTKVDTGVTFEYDGKSVTLNVNSGETAESAPTAGNPGAPAVASERMPKLP
jgi:hypothetical protein